MSGRRALPSEDWPKSNAHWLWLSSEKLSSVLGNRQVAGYPPPPWSSGIIDLAENFEVIYGAQQLRGKILSRRDLGPIDRSPLTPLSPWL
jgi:hypothetical protein